MSVDVVAGAAMPARSETGIRSALAPGLALVGAMLLVSYLVWTDLNAIVPGFPNAELALILASVGAILGLATGGAGLRRST